MNENTKMIRDLAAYVCDRLVGKVLIHRYDAYSTNSVYLKFDYGVANSLRIADHAGKEYLSYRFNIILTLTEASKRSAPGIGTTKRPWRTRRPKSPTNGASGNRPAR